MEKRKWQAFLFLLPSVFFFAVFSYWPLLQNLYLSFFSWNMVSPNMKFVGLDNYVSVLGSEELIKILVNTVVFVAIMLVLNFALPYLFSFVLGHLIERGKGFYRSALFMPATLSLAVASILFLWIYNPLAGPLSIVLSWFDIESPRWFKENWLVIFAICTIIGWKVFGYNLIVMLAAMLAVPKEMIEAAKLENASNWQIFKQIIVPMTSSTAIYVFTITVVFGLQYVLVPVNMLTQGGPDQGSSNLVYIIYQYAFVFFQTGKSAAFAIITMVCYIAFLLFRNYVSVLGSEELIKTLVNTVVFVAIMLVLNFVLPYLFSFVLGHLIERGKGFYRSALFMPATLSLAVASILFLWIYNPLAGPLSIVLSWFDIESPRWFKENWLVIFAICTIIGWKVFGYNLIVMLAAMLAVPKEMIEAAKLENASNWQIFKQIIVPMTSSTAIYVFTITVVFGLQYVLVPVNMLTQGGPDQGSSNLVYIIYQYAFVFFQTGKSAAFAIITMVCYIAFLLFRNKYLEKKVYYEN